MRWPALRFDADPKADKRDPCPGRRRAAPRARFGRIFRRTTGFVARDRLFARLHARKAELLLVLVLERPDIPLPTNSSESGPAVARGVV